MLLWVTLFSKAIKITPLGCYLIIFYLFDSVLGRKFHHEVIGGDHFLGYPQGQSDNYSVVSGWYLNYYKVNH